VAAAGLGDWPAAVDPKLSSERGYTIISARVERKFGAKVSARQILDSLSPELGTYAVGVVACVDFSASVQP
jgi:hypothetical protein